MALGALVPYLVGTWGVREDRATSPGRGPKAATSESKLQRRSPTGPYRFRPRNPLLQEGQNQALAG